MSSFEEIANYDIEDINNVNRNHSGNNNNNNNAELIYEMTLELESGKSEYIKIYSNSDPNQLAFEFCREHGLDQDSFKYLSQQIEGLLLQFKQQDNNQIEEVEDEQTIEENQNKAIYATNENESDMNQQGDNDSLRYSDNKESEEYKSERRSEIKEVDNDRKMEKEKKEDDNSKKEEEGENNMEEENEFSAEVIEEIQTDNEENNKSDDNNNTIQKINFAIKKEINDKEENDNVDEIPLQIINNSNVNNSKDSKKEDNKIKEENDSKIKIEKKLLENELIQLDDNDNDNEEILYNQNENDNQYKKINSQAENQIKESIENSNIPNFYNNQPEQSSKNTNEKPLQLEQPVRKTSNLEIQTNENIMISNIPLNKLKSECISKENNIIIKPKEKTKKQTKIDNIPIINYNNNTKNEVIHEYLTPKYSTSHKNEDRNIKEKYFQQNRHFSSGSKNSITLKHCSSAYTQQSLNYHNIFERLFKDAQIKRLFPKKPCHFSNKNSLVNLEKIKSNTQQNIKDNNLYDEEGKKMNYGEYMYKRDKEKYEEKQRQIELLKQEKETLELQQYTFHPILTEYNKESIHSIINQDTNGSNKNSFNALSYKIPINYRPKIAPYREVKIKYEIDQIYTFHPRINNNIPLRQSFQDRQLLNEQKRKMLRENYYNLPGNRKFLPFKPVLISKQFPKDVIGKEDLNVFNKNYNYYFKYQKNKKELAEKYNNNNYFIGNNYYDNNSIQLAGQNKTEQITNRVNRELFSSLFKELDRDQDNLISPISIAIGKLNKKILQIIQPLIIELKEGGHTLNEEEFILAMNKLYSELPLSDKHALIDTIKANRKRVLREEKAKREKINYKRNKSYRPVININTNKLAENYRIRIEKLRNNYFNSSNILNSFKKSNNNNKKRIISKSEYFNSNPKKNLSVSKKNFSQINNITFDNYLKNLN